MTDQGGYYSIKTLDLYFRILYFNQQNALYEVFFMIKKGKVIPLQARCGPEGG